MKKILVFMVIFLFLVSAAMAVPSSKKSVIIKFKDKVSEKQLEKLKAKGAEVKYVYSLIPAVALSIEEESIPEIISDVEVLKVENDQVLHVLLDVSAKVIEADNVWLEGVTGNGVNICIVDTGVDVNHPAIPPLAGWNDLVNGRSMPYDDHGHGTHVSGIAVSRDATYRGIAPGANLMMAKVCDEEGNCETSDLIAGIEWCVAQGADVLSISIGDGLFDEPCDDISFTAASNSAAEQGVVVIAASGNDGDTTKLCAPACGSKVISVGATDKNDNLAWFSNGGPLLDVVAPGVYIMSTWTYGYFIHFTGTSMAAPHVAGLSALLLEENPLLTPEKIREILRKTAVDLGDTGFDYKFGYGRVDAYTAYQEAANPCTDSDADGVLDYSEECPDGKDICPDSQLDRINLNKNQYAQNSDFGWFELGPNNLQSSVYNIEITKGCTCKQIAAKLGAGGGQIKKGCSPGLMQQWTGLKANSERGNKITGGVVSLSNDELAGLFGLGLVMAMALVILILARKK